MIDKNFKLILENAMRVCLSQCFSKNKELAKFVKEDISYSTMLNLCFNPDHDVVDISDVKLEQTAKLLIETFLPTFKSTEEKDFDLLENMISDVVIEQEDMENYVGLKKEQILKWVSKSTITLEATSMYIYSFLKDRIGHEDAKKQTIKTFTDAIPMIKSITGLDMFKANNK